MVVIDPSMPGRMPWKLLESTQGYIFVRLTGYGALLGPIAGIMIADYWIVRRSMLANIATRAAGTRPS